MEAGKRGSWEAGKLRALGLELRAQSMELEFRSLFSLEEINLCLFQFMKFIIFET
jgi:hypothetical protein